MQPVIRSILFLSMPLVGARPALAAAETLSSLALHWWVWGGLLALAGIIVSVGLLFAVSSTGRRETSGSQPADIDRLPMKADSTTPAAATPPESAPVFGGKRILVAEDNLTGQLVLKRLLENLGFEVDIAPNGRRAVELCREHTYVAVLMDIRMPVMDGLSATREIRARQEGRNLPIIGVTADTLQVDRTICQEAGMDDYLEKPVRRLALVQMLARWVDIPMAAEGNRVQPVAAEPSHGEGDDFSTRFMECVAHQVTDLEPHTIRVVADSYLSEVRRNLDRANHAMSQKDLEPMYSSLARLKSVSLEVGAQTMANLADGMAAMVKREAMEEAGQMLRRMWVEYNRLVHVCDELAAEPVDERGQRA